MGTTPPITTNNPQNTRSTKPDQANGPWLERDVWRVDLGHLATMTVTTRDAAIALADLLRTTQMKGKQMKSTNPSLITERDISLAIHQLDEYSRPDGGGVWVFRTVCFERVVLSSPGCLWPGRMDDHEEVLEAHA